MSELLSPCMIHGCSACCKDVSIGLSKQEADFLKEAGTKLDKEIGFPSGEWGVSVGRSEYRMDGACGHLGEDGLCKVYDDPRRPDVCDLLQPGPGFLGINGCNGIRISNGLLPLKRDGKLKEE